MKILSLDVATKTGWCLDDKFHGVWDLKLKRGESGGMKLLRLEAKIKEAINAYGGVDMVAIERPAGRHPASIIHQAELIGVVKRYCNVSGIEYSEYSASEIKKFATGKGNCNKQKMVEAVEALGYTVADDNEADAIHLWRMVREEFNT